MAALSIHLAQVLPALAWGFVSMLLLFLTWCICTIGYNLLLHPLALRYPGPFLGHASVLYQVYHELTGQMPHTLARLHEKYGPIVRIAPNELSFSTPQALQDIYGRQGQGRYNTLPKDQTFYGPGANDTPSILICSDEDHRRFRTLLNHAFTSKAVMSQESLLCAHVDKLIGGLLEKTQQGTEGKESLENLTVWFDCFGLDVISDLTYGTSFGCLDSKGEPTRETRIISGSLKASTWYRAIRRMPKAVQAVIHRILPGDIKKIRQARIKYSVQKIFDRMQAKDIKRPDVYWHISAADESKTMSPSEIASSLSILMAAGSETTATTLAGCIYLLLRSPISWKKLEHEIFSQFQRESDICLAKLSSCSMLSAILEETMRLYPPTPSTLPRRVPSGGAVICDEQIRAGVVVGVNHWVINRSSKYFVNSTHFAPERWLGDEAFSHDDRSAFKPFMLGSRNCIGQRLADAELRLVIARLVWNFDLQLEGQSDDWMFQTAFTLWSKKPLWVKFTRRNHNHHN